MINRCCNFPRFVIKRDFSFWYLVILTIPLENNMLYISWTVTASILTIPIDIIGLIWDR